VSGDANPKLVAADNTSLKMKTFRQRNGVLYSALVIAAVVVILISVIGIAVMTDMMPGLHSLEEPVQKSTRR
jgi:hypothetical protein